jgi:hypothetical protein
LPLIIYSAVCNEPFQEVNTEAYKGTAFLTSENKLYCAPVWEHELKEATNADLVDTDVRDFTSYEGTLFYVKNDNTVWAFGNNENNKIGPKIKGKDSSGYEVEIDYIPHDQPIKMFDDVANIYSVTDGWYDSGLWYLDLNNTVMEFKKKGAGG